MAMISKIPMIIYILITLFSRLLVYYMWGLSECVSGKLYRFRMIVGRDGGSS